MRRGAAQTAAIDEILRIAPLANRRITGTTWLQGLMTLFMLTVMMRSQTSSSIRVTPCVAGADADVVVEDVDTPGQAGKGHARQAPSGLSWADGCSDIPAT